MNQTSNELFKYHSLFAEDKYCEVLQGVLLKLIFEDLKVYLDGLGIIFSRTVVENINYLEQDQTTIILEEKKIIEFEKSYELSSFHFNKFKNIIEPKELALRLLPRLQKAGLGHLTVQDLVKDLKNFFNELRTEILVYGKSNKLYKIGLFQALKLNMDLNWRDRFGLADISMIPNTAKIINSTEKYQFTSPVLKNAWEPLASYYGEPKETKDFYLSKEIKKLGLESLSDVHEDRLRVAVFALEDPNDHNQEILIYCSENISALCHQLDKEQIGTELTIQTSVPKGSVIPEWPYQPMIIAWILLLGSNKKSISPGSLINFELETVIGEATNLVGIFTTSLSKLPAYYLSLSGKFRYLNLLGVVKSEATFAETQGTTALLDILTHKEHHQITRLNRRNIF